MRLLGLVTVCSLIAQTYAGYYYGADVQPNGDSSTPSVYIYIIDNFGTTVKDYGYFFPPAGAFIEDLDAVTNGIYLPSNAIPAAKFKVVDGIPTSVTVGDIEYTCVIEPFYTTQYICPPEGYIPNYVATTTTTTTTTSASPTPTYVSSSYGKKKGDGYRNYLCLTSADCIDSCIKGKCNGPTVSLTPVSCKSGVSGKKNGNGATGLCCTSNDDCKDTCINGTCGSVTTTTTTTSASPTPTFVSSSYGKKKGDGYNNYLCLTSADCIDSCIKGKCNGPNVPPTPVSCKSGVSGKKNGNGATGLCCTSNDDCKDTCIDGKCGSL